VNWTKPLRWNREAAAAGRRIRVFPSLCDPFDNEVPEQWRVDLFQLIAKTPHLDWLLLTKRIGNARRMLNEVIKKLSSDNNTWDELSWPGVWIGATVVNQDEANRDVPKLLAVPARVRFLSIEPMLGPINFESMCANPMDFMACANALEKIDWVIVGGESGPDARPMHPDWARSLRDQCAAAGVPFHFKQWGAWRPIFQGDGERYRVSEPNAVRVGKRAAGRLLDGVEHSGFPHQALHESAR
jgi:protein gp37